MSANGIRSLIDRLYLLESKSELVHKRFVERSLQYLEDRAREYIELTTGGSSWYELTHTLENSFLQDAATQRLINNCFYAAFVEYGTGVVGKGTHPLAKNYAYDTNEHGNNGWFFYDDEGNIHWTRGMKAHAYMYHAALDYYTAGYKIVFESVLDEIMGGMLND